MRDSLNSRGRLTLQDLPLLLMVFGIIGALTPAVYSVYNQNAGSLSTGEAYLVQILVPSMLIVVMGVVYKTATTGGGR